jgi:arylsulfatase A-like enzyme
MKGGEKARWVDEDMADYFIDKVKNFIQKNKENPFFLYYGLHQPHVPRAPHARFVGTTGMGPRGDAIAEADWCVGEVLEYLEELGLLENTLVIFSSDNGPVLNDGYKDQAVELLGSHTPAGPLRGGKYSLYDAGTHVPFFAYWKGRIEPITSDALVCQMDLLASLSELVGYPLQGEYDSENILPALLGKSTKGRTELILEANGKLALRMGDWAMIPPYGGPERNLTGNELGNIPDFGLYNLKEDVGQQENLSSRYPEKLKEMKVFFFREAEGYYKPNVGEIELK